MKTLVAVNILDSVNAEVYGSHCQEWFRLGRSTEDEFIFFYPNRFSIDNARNQAAQIAMQTECDFLYFIDDDIILSPNTYQSLKKAIINDQRINGNGNGKRSFGIAQALTFIRGYPFNPMMFTRLEEGKLDYFVNYEPFIDRDGLIECDAVGFSCVLIDVELIKQLNPPYFVTGTQTTEDVYFCVKARSKFGSDVRIVVDTKVPTGHLLQPEALSKYTRKDLLEHHKKLGSINKNEDRGMRYLLKCQEQFQGPIQLSLKHSS